MSAPTHPGAAVSVILPTYNRAPFLRSAFESISAQTFEDWDLIVVDDGSVDNTREIVASFEASRPGRVRYVHQANRGAYGARNTGVQEAAGRYFAFFDSDDLWMPHHLERSVTALERHRDLDWVFAACVQVDHASGKTIDPNTFYLGGQPRPFLSLDTEIDGDLRIITDPDVLECQILHGLYCGLQNSVMKREVFDGRRFNERSRVVDDELFVIRALAEGARFGYYMEPHVVYHVHGDNSSASATGVSLAKHIDIYNELTTGIEDLLGTLTLAPRDRRALRQRLAREYFWHLGYVGYWKAGRRREAIEMYRRGLAAWPWQASAWKTYVLARVRTAFQSAE